MIKKKSLTKIKYFLLRVGLLGTFLLGTFLLLTACLGKTRTIQTKTENFLLPKNKRKIFIAYPVNLTSHFELEQKVREGMLDYFQKKSLYFNATDKMEEAKSYMNINILKYSHHPTTVKFHDNQAVNRIFQTELEVSLQDPPQEFLAFSLTKDKSSQTKIYLDNKKFFLYRFYFLDLENLDQSEKTMETQFIEELAKGVEALLIKK